MEMILEEKEISPDGVRTDTLPHQYSFGRANSGLCLTLQGIMRDQANIGQIKFFSGPFSVKWKEIQKHHYCNMNKKKSARLWVVAILKKMMIV